MGAIVIPTLLDDSSTSGHRSYVQKKKKRHHAHPANDGADRQRRCPIALRCGLGRPAARLGYAPGWVAHRLPIRTGTGTRVPGVFLHNDVAIRVISTVPSTPVQPKENQQLRRLALSTDEGWVYSPSIKLFSHESSPRSLVRYQSRATGATALHHKAACLKRQGSAVLPQCLLSAQLVCLPVRSESSSRRNLAKKQRHDVSPPPLPPPRKTKENCLQLHSKTTTLVFLSTLQSSLPFACRSLCQVVLLALLFFNCPSPRGSLLLFLPLRSTSSLSTPQTPTPISPVHCCPKTNEQGGETNTTSLDEMAC